MACLEKWQFLENWHRLESFCLVKPGYGLTCMSSRLLTWEWGWWSALCSYFWKGATRWGTRSTGSEENGAWEHLNRWLSVGECLHFMERKMSEELVFDGGNLQLTNNPLAPGTLTKVSPMSLPLVVVDTTMLQGVGSSLTFVYAVLHPDVVG